MAAFIVPDRRLLSEPEVIEAWNGSEYFASGWITRDCGEIIKNIVFVEREGPNETIELHEILRIYITRSGFERSLIGAWQKWACGVKH